MHLLEIQPPNPMSTEETKSGVELIAAERARQISQEGWTPEHDDEHTDATLGRAAITYIIAADQDRMFESAAVHWPWDMDWYKPSSDPIRNLVKAGALIAAEIDRLQRATKSK
jgi:hypothetical protein